MKALVLGTLVATLSMGALAKGGEDRMMRGLDLSEAQQTQLMELRETHRAQMEPIREAHLAEMRAILTPEQIVKFDQRMQKMKAKMEKRRQKRDS